MEKSFRKINNENKALGVLIAFLVIVAIGMLCWFSYLSFLPAYTPIGATKEYESPDGAIFTSKSYSNLEVSNVISIKGQMTEYRKWTGLFSSQTEYHYEVSITIPESVDCFTIEKLTIRLAYGEMSDYDASSSLPEGGVLMDNGRSVFVEKGHLDFPFETGDAKYVSLYASVDNDSAGEPLLYSLGGNATRVTISGEASITTYNYVGSEPTSDSSQGSDSSQSGNSEQTSDSAESGDSGETSTPSGEDSSTESTSSEPTSDSEESAPSSENI